MKYGSRRPPSGASRPATAPRCEFGASSNSVSFGRVKTSQGVDFWPLTQRTFGVDNLAPMSQFRTARVWSTPRPVVGPIIINEILYHPPGGTKWQRRVHRIAGTTQAATVSLYDPVYPTNRWKLVGGVDFTFPAGVSLAAGEYLLVVDFNPTNTATLDAFRTRYGISSSVSVYGPFSGSLDNDGDSLGLYSPDTPQQPPAPDAELRAMHVLADRVNYATAHRGPAAPRTAVGFRCNVSRQISTAMNR